MKFAILALSLISLIASPAFAHKLPRKVAKDKSYYKKKAKLKAQPTLETMPVITLAQNTVKRQRPKKLKRVRRVRTMDKNSNTTRVKAQKKKKQPSTKYSSSFSVGIGTDSNPLDHKDGRLKGTFYQVQPKLSIENKNGFFTNLGGNLKDFTDQEISNQAKSNSINAEIGLKATLVGKTKSKTALSLGYTDEKWPDYLGGSPTAGMPMRYLKTTISQNLDWDFDKLNVGAEASYSFKDYSTPYRHFGDPLLYPQGEPFIFERDQKTTTGAATFGIELSDSVEVTAKPLVRHVYYSDRPSYLSDGSLGGTLSQTGNMEWIDSEIEAGFNFSFGPMKVVPSVMSGVRADQSNGAQDSDIVGGSLAIEATMWKANNFKMTAKTSSAKRSFDSHINLVTLELREDTYRSTSIGASVDIMKNLGFNLNYTLNDVDSTDNDSDLNFEQEIVSSAITLKF